MDENVCEKKMFFEEIWVTSVSQFFFFVFLLLIFYINSNTYTVIVSSFNTPSVCWVILLFPKSTKLWQGLQISNIWIWSFAYIVQGTSVSPIEMTFAESA